MNPPNAPGPVQLLQLFQKVAGRCSKAEFLELSDEIDRATEMLDHTGAILEAHIRRHCCLSKAGDGITTEP